MREHFQTEIDLINLSTILRLARIPGVATLAGQRYNAPDVRPLLIESHGHLPVPRLSDLVAADEGIEGVVRALSDTRYGQALAAGWQRYQAGEGDPTVLERELERWQAGQTVAMFTRNPLSIAIPIGYLGCKEIEVSNLRLISQAVFLGMPREQVRRDMIIV
jgi:vacuolar-type H+-ATPase subunit C/Vma6